MNGLLADPRLAGCRRLFLRDHLLKAHIGVHAFEKREAQRLFVNVDLYVPLAASTPQRDRLDEVVDYDFIRSVIADCAGEDHIELQETLCDAIATRLLEHPQVRAVRVSTEKPDVYADCAAVGVEVFHFRQERQA
ncbi:MAG: dihydroneopterin aldolase [Methylibium sp.]|uniref:dihydroneopterin aldolase n=1 Tax=Methylibium sp. TaxID=2067992 RepID=UPI001857A4BA|nr:dihydroneopterin aldolase [Methylibium sp.]MBA3592091.1 dihydroneopterin aldolase [Methylibium sp.]MBA3624862.1 dihydroneopterin aldolase [Methylibium sp.]